MASIDHFSELPPEMSLKILAHLEARDWLKFQMVNKSWQQLCMDPSLWARRIECRTEKGFGLRKFKKFLDLALQDSPLQSVRKVGLGYPLRENQLERCLQVLTKNNFPYPEKSIGFLDYDTGDLTYRQAYFVQHLVPCRRLSITAIYQHQALDLAKLITSQADSLIALKIDIPLLNWNTRMPLNVALKHVHLKWALENPTILFELFSKCPNLKQAHLVVRNCGRQAIELICSASSKSSIKSLIIDCTTKIINLRVIKRKEEPSIPGWNDPPVWPKYLVSLTLISAKEGHLSKIGGTLDYLEHLNISRSTFKLSEFLKKFQCSPSLKYLSLLRYNRGEHLSERLFVQCPKIEWLSLSHCKFHKMPKFNRERDRELELDVEVRIQLNNDRVAENIELNKNLLCEILRACPRLKALDLSFTHLPEKALVVMRDSQIKIAGINGLNVTRKASLEMRRSGIILSRQELRLECLSFID